MEEDDPAAGPEEFVVESTGERWRGEYRQLDRTGWEEVIFLLEDLLPWVEE